MAIIICSIIIVMFAYGVWSTSLKLIWNIIIHWIRWMKISVISCGSGGGRIVGRSIIKWRWSRRRGRRLMNSSKGIWRQYGCNRSFKATNNIFIEINICMICFSLALFGVTGMMAIKYNILALIAFSFIEIVFYSIP